MPSPSIFSERDHSFSHQSRRILNQPPPGPDNSGHTEGKEIDSRADEKGKPWPGPAPRLRRPGKEKEEAQTKHRDPIAPSPAPAHAVAQGPRRIEKKITTAAPLAAAVRRHDQTTGPTKPARQARPQGRFFTKGQSPAAERTRPRARGRARFKNLFKKHHTRPRFTNSRSHARSKFRSPRFIMITQPRSPSGKGGGAQPA